MGLMVKEVKKGDRTFYTCEGSEVLGYRRDVKLMLGETARLLEEGGVLSGRGARSCAR